LKEFPYHTTMNTSFFRSRGGFTLPELVVVITIIVVLS
jgi:prepilin-type N-terminal cleavage/methylation domain-containing protein